MEGSCSNCYLDASLVLWCAIGPFWLLLVPEISAHHSENHLKNPENLAISHSLHIAMFISARWPAIYIGSTAAAGCFNKLNIS